MPALDRLLLLPALALVLFVASCAEQWASTRVMTFPLVGRHEALSCAQCHGDDGALGPLPTACAACHTPPPDHYPGDCAGCHVPDGWDRVVIDHDWLPLTNAHDLPCADCHETPGTYTGLDAACESCHTSPPNHFPGPCADCHQPTSWDDATFDHTAFFPIPHRGVSACADCHPDATDRSVFTCTDCHAHRRSEMDDEHDDENGYVYASDACYRCHPDGREDD